MRIIEECRHLPPLAESLWTERHLVEQLLYKLVSVKLVLAADDRRFVPRALDEVDRVVEQLEGAQRARADAVAHVAGDWGATPSELTLGALAAESPEPWGSMFGEHRQTFDHMTGEIERTVDDHRRLGSAALREIHRSLNALSGPTDRAGTTHGQPARSATVPSRLDQVC